MTQTERYTEQGLRLAHHVDYLLQHTSPLAKSVALAELCAVFLGTIPEDCRWQWRKELFAMIDNLLDLDGKAPSLFSGVKENIEGTSPPLGAGSARTDQP